MLGTPTHRDSSNSDRFKAVCAMDFGTTYSGYAYSFSTNPKEISLNKNWGANLGFEVRRNVFIDKNLKANFDV